MSRKVAIARRILRCERMPRQRKGKETGISDRRRLRGRHEGVNSRKRRGEFNSRELARDEIAARRLVAGDLGHNYLNARGWINCCISHAKLILIHGPSGFVVRQPVISPSDGVPVRIRETGRRSVDYSLPLISDDRENLREAAVHIIPQSNAKITRPRCISKCH